MDEKYETHNLILEEKWVRISVVSQCHMFVWMYVSDIKKNVATSNKTILIFSSLIIKVFYEITKLHAIMKST